MTAYGNLRQNPFTSNYSNRVMDPEIHTIAEFDFLPGVYGIILQDRPAPTTVVIVENNTAQTPFTEVLTDPGANQYRVSYTRGIIEFNVANDGESVEVNYSGRGTNVTIELLQAIVSALASTFTNIIAATVAGLTFKNSSNNNIAQFGNGPSLKADFYGQVGLIGGTISAPGLAFTSDPNTGLISPSANKLGVVTDGQERFRVDENGRLYNVFDGDAGTNFRTTLHSGWLARAWVNFNGTGTVAIRASGNVSSITDNATSDYTVNFTNAMPDANYSTNVNHSMDFGSNFAGASQLYGNSSYAETPPTVSSFRFNCISSTAVNFDPKYVCVSVYR